MSVSDHTPDGARPNRAETEPTPSPTPRKRKHPGVQFKKGNKAGAGHGRPKRDEIIDLFFDGVVKGQTKDGQPFEISRREALLERLYASAMDVRRKDHTRLMEVASAYCFGKPTERLEMSGPDGKPIESADVTAPRRKTTGESRKRLEALWAKREAWVKAAVARQSNGHNGTATNGHTPGNGEGEEPGS